MTTGTPLSLDKLRAHFEALLRAAGTSPDAPTLPETWRAFGEFASVPVACDEESLFFECGLSPSNEAHFYVNFTRTFIGRDAGNHFWSHELNCDFLFESDEELEELGATIEAEELAENPDERAAFFERVNARAEVWNALDECRAVSGTIYVGES